MSRSRVWRSDLRSKRRLLPAPRSQPEIWSRVDGTNNDADEELRMSMLGMFLGAAMTLAAAEKEVYIAGADDPEKSNATV